MAYSKKDQFDPTGRRVADFAKALAHPARLAILKRLAEENSCVCGQIADAIPLAQSTVSQHLKALKEAGLIQGEIDGPKSCYCINDDAFKQLAQLMNDFLQSIAPKTTLKKSC
jgi:ArsR family transcriptional regulator